VTGPVNETLNLDIVWTMPLMKEVVSAARGGGGVGASKTRYAIYAALAVLVAFVAIRSQNFWLLMYPLLIVVIIVLQRWFVARALQTELDAPMRQGLTRVTLGPNRVEMAHRLSTTTFEWPIFIKTIEGRLALHLMISKTVSLPIPYETLPEGMTRDDLRSRIEEWRAGGVFA
jgi:hypothetical protein